MEEGGVRSDLHDLLDFPRREEVAQDSIVWGDIIPTDSLGQEGPALSPNAGINHHDVNGALGKVPIRTVEEKGSPKNILRGYAVAEIDHVHPRVNSENHPLHDPNKGISTPKIGQQRNKGSGLHSQVFSTLGSARKRKTTQTVTRIRNL